MEIVELIRELNKRAIHFLEISTLCFINSSYSSLMYAGSLIMDHVMKENKELSKVNMIQSSKMMMLTNIT